MTQQTHSYRFTLTLIAITLLSGYIYLTHFSPNNVGYAQVPISSESTATALPATATTSLTADFDSLITQTSNITRSLSFTPTITATATITPSSTESPSPTPTLTPTATPNPYSYLPLIVREPTPLPYIPPVTKLFCDSLTGPLYIPDNNPYGTSNDIYVNDPQLIVDLDITLNMNHQTVGDLAVQLSHIETGKSIYLIDRPGVPASTRGCGRDNIRTVLDDEINSPVEWKCAYNPAAISGIYIPENPLSTFDGESMIGTWRLDLSDHHVGDTGYLSSWCLVGKISPYGQTPTPTPPPPPPPPQAQVYGVTGKYQSLPLDCESRSAVDWARYFGHSIGELNFFNHLPHSDNPDKGFVGDVFGKWGQIPPNPYGVHAEPVAAVLRYFGVSAYAHRPLSWDALRAEIAAGRPVIAWIIGSVQNGTPIYYTPLDSLYTIVAPYEHTVIVTGYSESKVYYLNQDTIYARPIEQFLDSWSTLGNMAITALP